MWHEVGNFAKNALVPREARQAGERIRHDRQGKVPATPGGAGMARMGGAFIEDFESGGLERRETRTQGMRVPPEAAGTFP